MVNWPETLVTELADRRCIIFMGAGVSAASRSTDGRNLTPPTWRAFLIEALGLVDNEEYANVASGLIDGGQYLDAAQIIWDNSNNGDRAHFLRRIFSTPRYQPSEMHKLIYDIDPKIVITVNYDQIYENYCGTGGHNVCIYHNTHALNDIRSNMRCILKAHGCISDPTRIVLSRSSYFEARRSCPSFYSLLDALFLTNTILFLGAGLTDPDIQLVLENANIAVPSSNTHYALVPTERHPSIVRAIRNTYNIQLLEYERGQHHQAVEALTDLKNRVLSYREVHRG